MHKTGPFTCMVENLSKKNAVCTDNKVRIYIVQVAKVTVPFFLTITITEGGLVPKVFMEIVPYWLLVVKPACPPTAKIPLDWM